MVPPENWPLTRYAGAAWSRAIPKEPPDRMAALVPSGSWSTSAYQVPRALPDAVPTTRPTVEVADTSVPDTVRAALAEELTRVADARRGERNRQLWESARNLYNLVATGALDQREVDQGLLAAAERCGLLGEEPRQTRRTLASGRQVGLQHPRHPPPDRAEALPVLPLRAVHEAAKERG